MRSIFVMTNSPGLPALISNRTRSPGLIDLGAAPGSRPNSISMRGHFSAGIGSWSSVTLLPATSISMHARLLHPCRGATLLRCSCRRKAPERRFQVALRVDQEVGARHHGFAVLDARQHFDKTVTTGAQLDVTRLETPFGKRHQHHLPRAAVDDGRIGHGQHFAPGSQRRLRTVPYIPGLQFRRAGSRARSALVTVRVSVVQRRIDETSPPPGKGPDRERRRH